MGAAKQYLNIPAGVWLFASAFVWPSGEAQFTNTCANGLLCIVMAAWSGVAPRFRFLNTAIGVWVLITAFSIPSLSVATTWNNALMAIGIIAVSLLPPTPTRKRPRHRLVDAS